MSYIVISVILGFVTAFIAKSKGRDFGFWLVFGVVAFIVALPAVLLLGSSETSANSSDPKAEGFAPQFKHHGLGSRMELDTVSNKIYLKDYRGGRIYDFSEVRSTKSIHEGAFWRIMIVVDDVANPTRIISFKTEHYCNEWMSRLQVALNLQPL